MAWRRCDSERGDFFALSPFILLEPLTALRDIVGNREIVVDRAVAAGRVRAGGALLDMLWTDSAGQPIVALAIAGAVWMLAASPARAALLLAFPVPFLLFIVNTAPASRYLNPVMPFVALFAGWTIARAVARIWGGQAVFWIAVMAVAAPSLYGQHPCRQFFRQDDTRTLAQRYIEAHIRARGHRRRFSRTR